MQKTTYNNIIDILHKRIFGCAVLLSFIFLLPGCGDNQDDPSAGSDSDEGAAEAMPAEALIHSNLAGALYSQLLPDLSYDLEEMADDENPYYIYEPSKGSPVNDGDPYTRYEVAASYEEALKDFSRLLPTEEAEARFVIRQDNQVSISTNKYGTVIFKSDNTDGAVAVMEIALQGYHPYKIYYRPIDSLGDNYGADENLDMLFNPGDVVEYMCQECKKSQKRDWAVQALVIEVSSHACYVFTKHNHTYDAKDHWKSFPFTHNLVSIEGWRQIKDSWDENRDLFLETEKQTHFFMAIALKEIMTEWAANKYLVVDGNDVNAHKELYWARWTWYSKVKLLKVGDLRNKKYSVNSNNYYAYRASTKWSSDYYSFSLVKLVRSQISDIKKVYPLD